MALLAVPLAIVSVFLIGESIARGLDASLGHILQLVPLLPLVILAGRAQLWRWPR